MINFFFTSRSKLHCIWSICIAVLLIGSNNVYSQINWESACANERIYNEKTGTYEWKGTRGKYFCIEEEEKEEKELPDSKPQEEDTEKENKKEKDCSDPEQWDSSCGFVDPDSLPPEEAFDFQAQQRDVLLQNMAVRPESMGTVKSAQQYISWVVDKAMLLSDMYEYTAVQNPELDPNAEYTSSSFAQQLIASQKLDNRESFWKTLNSWDGEIVIFTRASCPFCEQQGKTLEEFVYNNKLTVVEVALEDACVIPYADDCVKGEEANTSAKQFNVDTVPTTLVFIPNQEGKTPADGLWLRISNGFSIGSTIRNRLYSYLNAWYAAAANGVEDSSKKPQFNEVRALNRRQLKDHLSQVVGTKDKEDSK